MVKIELSFVESFSLSVHCSRRPCRISVPASTPRVGDPHHSEHVLILYQCPILSRVLWLISPPFFLIAPSRAEHSRSSIPTISGRRSSIPQHCPVPRHGAPQRCLAATLLASPPADPTCLRLRSTAALHGRLRPCTLRPHLRPFPA